MKISPYWHQLCSIVVLSLSTLLVFTGYDTQSFVVESALHSVNKRDNARIDQHAGYYGQAVVYLFYTLSTLVAPWISMKIGSKWSLLVGTVLFTLYDAGFFHINSFYYYTSSAFMGLGFALYYAGQGLYMSEHSTRRTLSRNSALISSIGNSGPLLGGLILYVIFKLKNPEAHVVKHHRGVHNVSTTTAAPATYREFADVEITAIWGVFVLVSVIGNVLMGLLPQKQFDSIEQTMEVKKPTLKEQIGLVTSAAIDRRILTLVPFFVFYGLHVSFWISALPTTFAFSKHTSHLPELAAYYSAAYGLGSILIGVYINIFSKWFKSFGLIPTMLTQIVLGMCMYTLVVASTPNLSTIVLNDQPALWIQPGVLTCLVLGVLNGMIDCCSCTMRAFICIVAVPDIRHQAYSVAKLYQALSSCIFFFLSPHLTAYRWITILSVAHVLSAIGFIYQAWKVQSAERKIKAAEISEIIAFPEQNPYEKF